MPTIHGRIRFEGDGITDAFRFWFDHPGVDYGYALRQTGIPTQETKFYRAEEGSP